MKKYIGLTAVLFCVLFTGTAHAEDSVPGSSPIVPRHPLTDGSQPTRPPRMQGGDHMMMGSSTKPMGGAQGMMDHGDMRKGIPGVVSALAANGFMMTSRGLGRDAASTTLTVVVTGTTNIQSGSTTATLADITVGSKVEVFGKVATSTKTITAERIRINNGQGDMHGRGTMMREDHGNMASGTANVDVPKRGFMEKLRGFLGGSTASGTPAGTGFLDYISSAFFGLFK